MNRHSNRSMLLVITGLTVLSIAISLCARWNLLFPGDLQITLLVQSFGGRIWLLLMECISYLMGGWRAAVLVAASGIAAWCFLGRWEASLVLIAGLCSLFNSLIKLWVNRPRPTTALVQVLATADGSGFPSGHAMFAAILLGFLAYLAATNLRRRSLSILTFTGLLVLILLTGVSRVYLGVHWPSDVVGGYLIGLLFLVALIWSDRVWQTHVKGKV